MKRFLVLLIVVSFPYFNGLARNDSHQGCGVTVTQNHFFFITNIRL